MLKFIESTNSKFFVAILLTSTMALSTILMQQSYLGRSQGFFNLNTGVNTCFTRVNQTFTSIMIQQLQSPYLTREFTDLTSSCFNDLQKEFESIISTSLLPAMSKEMKSINSSLNQIVSDTHWFHEKVLKIKDMAINSGDDEGFSLTNSNILNKYSALEVVKDNVFDQIQVKRTSVEGQSQVMQFFGIGFMLLSLGLGVAWFVNARKKSLNLIEVESIASNMLNDSNIANEKVDRLMEMAFNAANLPKTLELVQSTKFILPMTVASREDVEAESIKEHLGELALKENLNHNGLKTHITNLNNAFNAALKGVQNKAFTYGVIIDFDLDDDLMVHGEQEDLQQVIYTTINYAIDSSMLQNQGRKIIIRSKALGGTIYLKVSVTNHCFNANELEYLTDSNSTETDVNVNLVMIKELASVNQTQFSVTNKVNSAGELRGSEVEFLFNRADVAPSQEQDLIETRNADQIDGKKYFPEDTSSQDESLEDSIETEQSQKKLSSIMRGSKKEIMARLNSERDLEV